VWSIVEDWLRGRGQIAPLKASVPRLIGVEGEPGIG